MIERALRHTSFRRRFVALGLCGVLFSGVACDQFKSDQQRADERVKKAAEDAAAKKTPTTQGIDAAISELRKAVAETAASDSAKIRARALLAQTEYEAGEHLLRELHRIEPQISQAMWEIGQLAGQIASINVTAQALAANDPKTALATVTAKEQEFQQAAAAAGEKVKALQGQIAQIQGQIKSLTDQKNQVQAQADDTDAEARNLSEKEATPLLLQAIETRRKAANIGHDIDRLSASLAPLQRDLALEQAKQKSAQEALAALEQRKQTFAGNWSTVQEQVGKERQLAADLTKRLSDQADQLDTLVKQAASVRNAALDRLTKAADDYASASRAASQLSTTLQTYMSKYSDAPERKAWQELKNLYDLNNFKLLEGHVRNTIGNVQAAHAKLAGARKQLATEVASTLQQAGQTVPPTLAGTADQDLANATKSADEAFKAAAVLMDNVANVGQPAARPAGQMGQLFAAYGQYLTSGKVEDLNLAKDQYAKLKDEPAVNNLPQGMRQVLSAK